MTKLIGMVVALGVVVSVSVAAQKPREQTWTGKISDSNCKEKHAAAEHEGKPMTDADCTRMCVKKGAKYVFVSDGKVYQLADPEAPPYAGRDFAKTDRLLVRFSAYWDGEVPPEIKAQLLSRSGTALTSLRPDRTRELSAQEPNVRGGTYQIDLPLSSIARGEYVISIEAARGEDHAQALVPLRVVQ